MAIDAELQIVTSQVVDVSEGTNQLSSSVAADVLTLGRRGFSRDTHFIVAIEAVIATTPGANVIPMKFILQVAPDGTNYIDVATIHLTLAASLAKLGVWSIPIGLTDYRVEQRDSDDVICRVNVTYTNNGETDDLTYSAWIGGPGHGPQTDVAV
jgi:hypothetical protein